MRKLPVYLLLDCSYSMKGEPIDAVNNGTQQFALALREDPRAAETVKVSVITFGGTAQQVVSMSDVNSLSIPTLNASSDTPLGAALSLLADSIDREVQKGSMEQRADWKPLVFILTDGVPTDDINPGLEALRARKTGVVVACGAGSGVDVNVLKQITQNVVQLESQDQSSIRAFFKWISHTVRDGSRKSTDNNIEIASLDDMSPMPSELQRV